MKSMPADKSVSALFATLITTVSLIVGGNAAITVLIQNEGANLKMTATGSYDVSLLTPMPGLPLGANAAIAPDFGNGVYGWEHGASDSYAISFTNTLTGNDHAFPADFVSLTNPFGFDFDRGIISFTAGSPSTGLINEVAIFNNQSLSSLGMIPGEVMSITWLGDSATIATIPEASSLLMVFGGIAIALRRSRK